MNKEKILYLFNYLVGLLYRNKSVDGLEINRILIVKQDEIGDMIYAIPVIDLVRERFPHAELLVWCKPIASQLLESQTSIDKIVHQMPSGSIDLWIEMRGSYYTFFRSLWARPKLRYDRGTIRLHNKLNGGQKQELYTNLQIIAPLFPENTFKKVSESIKPTIHLNRLNHFKADVFITENNLSSFCILHTGARDEARRWPIERYAELAYLIKDRLDMDIVLAGGPDEMAYMDKHLNQFPLGTVSFCGKGSLNDFAALCLKAKFFIGNESGPMHIASASNIPLIALFGPGVKDVFYPLNKKSLVIHYFNDSNHTKQSAKNSSILRISVAEVWGNLVKLLN